LVTRFILAISIVVLIAGEGAQAWVWPYRPEYAFGWGYLPPFGFGYHWKYPYINGPQEPPLYDVVPPSDMSGFCARRFRTYDPITQTYIGPDGRRRSCP
jgi:hypothetical protein